MSLFRLCCTEKVMMAYFGIFLHSILAKQLDRMPYPSSFWQELRSRFAGAGWRSLPFGQALLQCLNGLLQSRFQSRLSLFAVVCWCFEEIVKCFFSILNLKLAYGKKCRNLSKYWIWVILYKFLFYEKSNLPLNLFRLRKRVGEFHRRIPLHARLRWSVDATSWLCRLHRHFVRQNFRLRFFIPHLQLRRLRRVVYRFLSRRSFCLGFFRAHFDVLNLFRADCSDMLGGQFWNVEFKSRLSSDRH